jgi:hypothetical protein
VLLQSIDDMLRGRGPLAPGAERIHWGRLPAWVLGAGLLYGAVMGAYSLRRLQMLYSSLKVPM